VNADCLCPSGRARPGAQLIGVQSADGVGYVLPPLPVDQAFLDQVDAAGSDAGRRFRFTEPCVERGCRQWSGDGCGLIGRLLESDAPKADQPLPACGIRGRCRWYSQQGAKACHVCRYVVTDNTATLAPIHFADATANPGPSTGH
jgi:hypothetical protein